jgi:AcrR family transcriptional regulator
MATVSSHTRQLVLAAALKEFADHGYEGASVQEIVEAARVTKPTLYYYFPSKAELYQALVDYAHDERLRLMQAAAARGGSVVEQLTEILAVLFEFVQGNRELMRIAFATAFASAGELPNGAQPREKCARNFEFLRNLIEQGQARGELGAAFDSRELALAFYGQFTIYAMADVLMPDRKLDRQAAARMVELFVEGAAGCRTRTNRK